MKIFLSWSGERSRRVAELLRGRIKASIQATDPWISSKDLDRGVVWFQEIGSQLKDTSFGIICVTNENKDKPWILFESGALAKDVEKARVCTLLVDLQPSDVEGPLAQFNHSLPTRQGMHTLLETLNKQLGTQSLEDATFEEVFESFWTKFDKQFATLIEETKSGGSEPPPRPAHELLAEVLDLTRSINARLAQPQFQQRCSTPSESAFSSSEKWAKMVVDAYNAGGQMPVSFVQMSEDLKKFYKLCARSPKVEFAEEVGPADDS